MRTLTIIFISLFQAYFLTGQSEYSPGDTSLAIQYLEEAKALREQQLYDQALEKAQLAQVIYKKLEGEESEHTVEASIECGLVNYKSGSYDKAIEIFEDAILFQRKLYGEEHEEVAQSLYILGVINRLKGDYGLSFKYHQEAFGLRKKLFGQSHIDLARSYHDLSIAYDIELDYTNAISMLDTAIQIFLDLELSNSKEMASTYSTAGIIYGHANRREEAIEFHEKALKIRRDIFGEEHTTIADTYTNLGVQFQKMGDDKKAIEFKEKSLEINKKILGEQHPNVAIDYNNLSSSYGKMGQHDLAIEYAKKAIEIYEEKFGENHPHLANFYDNLGNRNDAVGRYDVGLEHKEKALEIRVNLFGEDAPAVAASYRNLGQSYDNLRKFDQAIEMKEKALRVVIQSTSETNIEVAKIYEQIGDSYRLKEQYHRSIEYLELALKIQNQNVGENNVGVAGILDKISFIYGKLGEYQMALSYTMKTLEILNELLEPLHPIFTVVYNRLGLIYKDLGDYESAIEHLQKALNLKIEIYGARHHRVGDSYVNIGIIHEKMNELSKGIAFQEKALEIFLNSKTAKRNAIKATYTNLGINYDKIGDFIKAADYFNKALEVSHEIYGEEHLETASAYNNLGITLNNKKNYDEAIKYHLRALEIRKKLLGDDGYDLANSYQNLALSYRGKKSYSKAIEYAQRSIAIRTDFLGTLHPELGASCRVLGEIYHAQMNYPQAESTYLKSIEAFNYTGPDSINGVNDIFLFSYTALKIGELYKDWFARESNDYEHLESAQFWLEIGAGITSDLLIKQDNFEASELSKVAFPLMENLIETHLLNFDNNGDVQLKAKTFNHSEKSKSFRLYKAMKEAKALHFSNIPDELINEENHLRNEITFYEKSRAVELEKGKTEIDSSTLALSGLLFDLRSRYDSLKMQFEKNYPEYYRLKYDLSTISLEEVQQQILKGDQTLVEYFVGDSSIFVFTVAKNHFDVVQIKKDFPLDSLIQQMRLGLYGPYVRKEEDIDPSYRNKTSAAERFAEAAHLLYQKLVAPVETKLGSRVTIIPDGVLGYVPFQALIKEKSGLTHRFKEHQYLGMNHRISYSYSATLLKEMINKEHRWVPKKSVLAVAPHYDGTSYKITPERLAELEKLGIADLVGMRNSPEPLPHSGEETQTIRSLWKGDVLQQKEATEERFIKSAGDYQILHLATHGEAHDQIGEFAYLAFTEIKDDVENELLYIKDIYNLQLNADLVVLSACQTGIGELQRGEGIISLARAFAYAGAKSIVTTLWSVKDQQTKDIMIDFHINLKKGMDKDTALWQAQRKYLESNEGEKASPYYWAPFVSIGDMEAID